MAKKKVAVDDVSAFYLPHFTFFMSFKDVFSPLCLSHCEKEAKKKWKKKIYKTDQKKKIKKIIEKKILAVK